MTTGRIVNVALFVVLMVLAGANVALRRDYSERNLVGFLDMGTSPAYESLALNPNYENGQNQQSAPEGTIARGYLPLHYAATPEDARRAGEELVNLFHVDDARALERGAWAFQTYCAACHGTGGLGDGLVAKRGFPPPPSLLGDNARSMKDGQIFHIITYGQKNMPAHESQIERDDRWKAVLHIRALQAQK